MPEAIHDKNETSPALILPEFSVKQVIGQPLVSLNGKATSSDGRDIVCKQIAYLMVTQNLSSALVSSLISIEKLLSIDMIRNNDFDKHRKLFNGEHYYFIP